MSKLSLPIAVVHPAHPVGSTTSSLQAAAIEPMETAKPSTVTSTTALSFAFDRVTQSLQVIITDQVSGEVLRKLEYTAIPSHTHQTDKLQGLLLDQLA
jgi:hypothetical protein